MRHRRILVPLALAGSFGIALAPTFASASTTSHATALSAASSSAVAKAAGFKEYSSPASKSVFSRRASSNTTTPNPKLAVAVTVVDTSAYGVQAVVKVTGLTTGDASLKIAWGDSAFYTSITPTTTTVKLSHEYGQVGDYNISTTVSDSYGDSAVNNIDVTTAGSDFTPYGVWRLLDTRTGLGTTSAGPVPAHGTLKFKVTGKGVNGDPVPNGITAVALNVTVTQEKAIGVLAAYNDEDAYGDPMTDPGTSNLNFSKDKDDANLVIVPVGKDGVIDFHNESTGSTQVVADIEGYFSTGSVVGYYPVTPTRIIDTGTGLGTGKVAKVAPGGDVTLKIAGDGPVSELAEAAEVNITATGGTRGGFITAHNGGPFTTNSSTLNYAPGQTVANNAIVAISNVSNSFGEITLHNSSAGSVNLSVDVSGYFAAGGSASGAAAFVPLPEPLRLLDTRQTEGAFTLVAGKPLALPFTQDSALKAWVFNTTVTDTTGNGSLTVYPYDPKQPSAVPATPTLDYTKGETVPNLTLAAPGTVADSTYDDYFDTGFEINGTGTAQFVLDAFGFFYNK